MNHCEPFVFISGLVFLLLFVAWNRNDVLNLILKFFFGVMTVWAIICFIKCLQ